MTFCLLYLWIDVTNVVQKPRSLNYPIFLYVCATSESMYELILLSCMIFTQCHFFIQVTDLGKIYSILPSALMLSHHIICLPPSPLIYISQPHEVLYLWLKKPIITGD